MEEGRTNWVTQLDDGLKNSIERCDLPAWETLDHWPRACRLAGRAQSLNLEHSDLASLTIRNKPVFCVVEQDGNLNVREIDFRNGEEVRVLPEPLSYLLRHEGFSGLLKGAGQSAHCLPWNGEACVFLDYFGERPQHPLAMICPISISDGFEPLRLQFLIPPEASGLPLVQRVCRWSSATKQKLTQEMVVQGLSDPASIPPSLMPSSGLGYSHIALGIAVALPFATPFSTCLALGLQHWNRLHPTTLVLQRVLLALWLQPTKERDDSFRTELSYLIEHALSLSSVRDGIDPEVSWKEFWELCRRIPHAIDSQAPSFPTKEDFVLGIAPYDADGEVFRVLNRPTAVSFDRPFGQLINEWPFAKSTSQ